MRQTRTFLAGDIEGSTRRWISDEEAMSVALAEHDSTVAEIVSDAGGEVFKHTGDGFFASFEDPLSAITSAVDIQFRLDLPMRMAVATGAAETRDGDWFGGILSRTARLMDSGSGGQVLVGEVTASLVREQLADGFDLVHLGRHRFRDLHEPYDVFQLGAPDLEAGFPPIKSLESFPNNLPIQMTSFIGRVAETDASVEMLEASRLVTLTGVGGVGKTRLALAAAAAALESFPGGVWFVELASLADPGLIATQTMTAMGASADGREPVEIVIGRCAEPTLIVLDNCEHLIDDVAKFAENVLRGAPSAKVMATSREGLGVMGESVYRVPSLRGDEGLADAVELFASRARQVAPDFELGDANQASVEQICRRLDGIPLAIELATARLRVLDAAGIAERLDDRFRLLTGGARTALPRQRTLAATMDWSYDLLSEKEQAMLRRLAVFAGSFSFDAAEAVCTDEFIDDFEVLDLVERLVSASLVTIGDPGRFRMLETVRQYAVDKLADSGEMPTWRDRHAAYFDLVASTVNVDLLGSRASVVLGQLLADHDNLRLAMTHSLETDNPDRAGRIADGCMRFWQTISHFDEMYDWCRRTVDRVTDDELRGWLATNLALAVSNLRRPHEEWEKWEGVFRELVPEAPTDDPVKRLMWWHKEGLDLEEREHFRDAYDAYLTAADMAAEEFPSYVVPIWMALLVGVTLEAPPRYSELMETLESMFDSTDDPSRVESGMGILALALLAEGDEERSREMHERHRAILPDDFVSLGTLGFWATEAQFAVDDGDLDRARQALSTLRNAVEAHSDWRVYANSIEARIEVADGRPETAAAAMHRTVEGIDTNRLPDVVTETILVLHACGADETAIRLLTGGDTYLAVKGLRVHPWGRVQIAEVRRTLGLLEPGVEPFSLEIADRAATKEALVNALGELAG